MRVIVQRVAKAAVTINGHTRKEIGQGLALLVGFCEADRDEVLRPMADKVLNLRIFSDEAGAMNLSVLDISGALLVVSNFTLYANSRKGRRPSFVAAARPEQAIPWYEQFLVHLQEGKRPMECGEFGADMQVEIQNDGPVTIILDSDELFLQKG